MILANSYDLHFFVILESVNFGLVNKTLARLHHLNSTMYHVMLKERWTFQQVESHWMKIELASIPSNKLPLDERLQPIVWIFKKLHQFFNKSQRQLGNICRSTKIERCWIRIIRLNTRQSNRSQQSPRLRWHSKIKRKQQAKQNISRKLYTASTTTPPLTSEEVSRWQRQ